MHVSYPEHQPSGFNLGEAEMNAPKRLPAETAAELDDLLPAILDRAFKGES